MSLPIHQELWQAIQRLTDKLDKLGHPYVIDTNLKSNKITIHLERTNEPRTVGRGGGGGEESGYTSTGVVEREPEAEGA